MKYKIMTIAVASLLPLGFAASASANPTADHEVTYTVADARSISVEVLGTPAAPGVLDLGTVGTNEASAEVADAVAVTFRATDAVDASNKVDIRVQLMENNEGTLGSAVDTEGVYLIANAADIVTDGFTLGEANSKSNEKGTPYVGSSSDYLYRGLNKNGGFDDTTFNVGFQLDTQNQTTTTGNFSYFILYSLTNFVE